MSSLHLTERGDAHSPGHRCVLVGKDTKKKKKTTSAPTIAGLQTVKQTSCERELRILFRPPRRLSLFPNSSSATLPPSSPVDCQSAQNVSVMLTNRLLRRDALCQLFRTCNMPHRSSGSLPGATAGDNGSTPCHLPGRVTLLSVGLLKHLCLNRPWHCVTPVVRILCSLCCFAREAQYWGGFYCVSICARNWLHCADPRCSE